jgi:low temperature requirement protein LtrA
MTPPAWMMLGALALFVAGAITFDRRTTGRTRVLGILGVLAVALVIGWFGWLLGTQA